MVDKDFADNKEFVVLIDGEKYITKEGLSHILNNVDKKIVVIEDKVYIAEVALAGTVCDECPYHHMDVGCKLKFTETLTGVGLNHTLCNKVRLKILG